MGKKKKREKKQKTQPATPNKIKRTTIRIIVFIVSLGVPGAYFYDIAKTWYWRNNPVQVQHSSFSLNTQASRVGTFEIHNRSDIPIYGISLVVKFDNPSIHTDNIHVRNKAIDWSAAPPKEYGDFAYDAIVFKRQDKEMKLPPLAVTRIDRLPARESRPFEVVIDAPSGNLSHDTNVTIQIMRWSKEPATTVGYADSKTLSQPPSGQDLMV